MVPFSSHFQSFPASRCFQMSQLFASGGQSFGVSVSTSVFPMNIQDWFPLEWTCLISLQSKGLSRVFSNISCYYILYICIYIHIYSYIYIYIYIRKRHLLHNSPYSYIYFIFTKHSNSFSKGKWKIITEILLYLLAWK